MTYRYRPSSVETGGLHYSSSIQLTNKFEGWGLCSRRDTIRLIRLVMHTPKLQHYTVSKLFLALKQDVTRESLTLAAVWLVGELSSILMEQGAHDRDSRRSV